MQSPEAEVQDLSEHQERAPGSGPALEVDRILPKPFSRSIVVEPSISALDLSLDEFDE